MGTEVIFFWAGVVFLVVGVSVAAVREWKGEQSDNLEAVRDSDDLRTILWKWEAFVLEQGGTVREIKRVANRARFLTAVQGADEGGNPSMEAVVAFVALEQCELVRDFIEDAEFEKWRAGLGDAGLPEGWADVVTKEQWEHYREAVGSSRG